MNPNSETPSWLPNIGVLLLVAWGIWTQGASLQSQRPPGKYPEKFTPPGNTAFARVWEDPIQVSDRSREIGRAATDENAPPPVVTGSAGVGTLALVITLPPGYRPEAIEKRIRIRQAVVAALTQAQYQPESTDLLRFALVSARTADGIWKAWFQIPCEDYVPIRVVDPDNEIRRARLGDIRRKYHQVRVFYVAEDLSIHHLRGTPIQCLASPDAQLRLHNYWRFWPDLVQRLQSNELANDRMHERHPYPFESVKVLGPTSSDGLARLLALKFPQDAARVTYLTPWPSVDAATLRHQVREISPLAGSADLLSDPRQLAALADLLPGTARSFATFHDTPTTASLCAIQAATAPLGLSPWVPRVLFPTAEIFRLAVPDDQLAGAIVAELTRNHGVDLADPHQAILLVSESDTLYGRAFPTAFQRALHEHAGTARIGIQTPRFSYLQGIDGSSSTAGESGTGAVQARGSGDDSLWLKLGGDAIRWRPLGTPQYDRITALAEKIRAVDAGLRAAGRFDRSSRRRGIVAVGVVGSDVYDKLVILQALRSALPQADFFTTDIDASLLTTENYPFTRNLLVASSYGRTLHPDWRQSTPPFRDTYQTGLFYSTLAALEFHPRWLKLEEILRRADAAGSDEAAIAIPELGPNAPFLQLVQQPNLFEISSTGEIPLRRNLPPAALDPAVRQIDGFPLPASAPNLVPPEPVSFYQFAAMALVTTISLFAFTYLIAPPIARRGLPSHHEEESGGRLFTIAGGFAATGATGLVLALQPTPAILVTLISLGAAGGILTAALAAAGFAIPRAVPGLFLAIGGGTLVWSAGISDSLPDQEPWGWFNGASVWPSEFIRYLSVALGCFYLIRGGRFTLRDSSAAQASIQTVIDGLRGHPPSEQASRLLQSVQARLEALCHRPQWNTLGILLGVPAALLIVGAGVVWLLGTPNRPIRGDFTRTIDLVLILSTLFIFYALLVFSFLTTWRSMRSLLTPPLEQIARTGPGLVPPPLWAALLQKLETHTSRMGNLTLYPCHVLLLLILSRNPIFDRWDFPPSLIIGTLGALTFLVAQTLILSSRASRLRRSILFQLENALARIQVAAATGRGQPADAEPLGKVIATISGLKGGCFGGFLQNPVFRAALLPIGGTGIITMVEYASTIF